MEAIYCFYIELTIMHLVIYVQIRKTAIRIFQMEICLICRVL